MTTVQTPPPGAPSRRLGEVIIEALIVLAGASTVIIVALIFIFLLQEGMEQLPGHPAAPTLWPALVSYRGLFWPAAAPGWHRPGNCGRGAYRRAAGHHCRDLPGRDRATWLRGNPQAADRGAGRYSIHRAGLSGLGHAPTIIQNLGAPTGLTAFTGSLLLAYMALPTIISIYRGCAAPYPRYHDAKLAGHRRYPVADHLAGGAASVAPAW